MKENAVLFERSMLHSLLEKLQSAFWKLNSDVEKIQYELEKENIWEIV